MTARSTRRPVLAVPFCLAAVIALSACTSGDGGDDRSPTVAPPDGEPESAAESPSEIESLTPTESVAGVDVTTVPPVEGMTAEYVQAVVNTIEEASGEIFAAVLDEPVNPLGAVPSGTVESFEQLFAGDRLAINVEDAEALAISEEARAVVLPADEYVGVRYSVEQVSYAEPGCMIAVGRIDRSGTLPNGGPDPVLSILSFGLAESGPSGVNETPWIVLDTLTNTNADGEPNSDEFAYSSTLSDFGDFLVHDCENGESSRVDG